MATDAKEQKVRRMAARMGYKIHKVKKPRRWELMCDLIGADADQTWDRWRVVSADGTALTKEDGKSLNEIEDLLVRQAESFRGYDEGQFRKALFMNIAVSKAVQEGDETGVEDALNQIEATIINMGGVPASDSRATMKAAYRLRDTLRSGTADPNKRTDAEVRRLTRAWKGLSTAMRDDDYLKELFDGRVA